MRTVLIALALLCLAGSGRAYSERPQDTLKTIPGVSIAGGEGRSYLDALTVALGEVDRIVVTEQSSADDLFDPDLQNQRPVDLVPTVYVSRVLNPTERLNLIDTVKRVDPNDGRGEPACIFDPHHAIKFYKRSRLTSVMQICFACGQVRWAGSSATRPDALIAGLQSLILQWGMNPDRDWRSLAHDQSKQPPATRTH